MSASNKILQAAAGNAAGESVYVEDVFSTYLYEGNSGTQSINNGIDLSGEGGLVWLKSRTNGAHHELSDTARGVDATNGRALRSNDTSANVNGELEAFNSNGFTLGFNTADGNSSGQDYCSWTFRKQAGFFDVVTYTGDGSSTRNIAHNLGSAPGMIIVKVTSHSDSWYVYHRSLNDNSGNPYFLQLNSTAAQDTGGGNFTTPSATHFGVRTNINTSGYTYVAYLFAHDDQQFGDDSDEAIIKCGSATTNWSSVEVNLGFEPQFVIAKVADRTDPFRLFDNMRGVVVGGNDAMLRADETYYENQGGANDLIDFTSTGFIAKGELVYPSNLIYIAIRRPMKTPEAGTEVFAASYNQEVASATSGFYSGFPVDLAIKRIITASQPNYLFDRLRGAKSFTTNANSAEGGFGAAEFDHQEGFYYDDDSSNTNDISWMFKRATGFLDVVAYSGNGTSGRSITHNLGVTPELMIIKKRNGVGVWQVAHKDVWGSDKSLYLNLDSAAGSGTFSYYFYQAPTSSVFYVTNQSSVNGSGDTFVAYLFATVAGVSKVGSYTGTGSDQNIDCGFSSGARFVLIKRTDSSANWNLYDSIEQGIVAGNDPHIFLNTNGAQETSDDKIDPYSAGFTVVGSHGHVNASSGEYIFLAIA